MFVWTKWMMLKNRLKMALTNFHLQLQNPDLCQNLDNYKLHVSYALVEEIDKDLLNCLHSDGTSKYLRQYQNFTLIIFNREMLHHPWVLFCKSKLKELREKLLPKVIEQWDSLTNQNKNELKKISIFFCKFAKFSSVHLIR